MESIKDRLKELSDRKSILMKQIIADSGVSQAHFYKVINGERPASDEFKRYLASILGMSIDELAVQLQLLESSKSAQQKESINLSENTNGKKYFLLFVGVGVLLMSLLGASVWSSIFSSGQPKIPTTEKKKLDKSKFVKDVTIPDGSPVKKGSTFIKTWRIRNIGQVVWENRYLQRMTVESNFLCQSVQKVPIKRTKPGEIVDISVAFTAPNYSGSCHTDWKMTNSEGELVFPNLLGLYMIVQVVD